MEIGHIQSLDRHEHKLRNPQTGEVLLDDKQQPIIIVIASAENPEYRKRRTVLNRELRALAIAGNEEQVIDQTSVKAAVAAVLDWRDLTVDGAMIADAPGELMALPKMAWLVNQILQVQNTAANFIQTSANG